MLRSIGVCKPSAQRTMESSKVSWLKTQVGTRQCAPYSHHRSYKSSSCPLEDSSGEACKPGSKRYHYLVFVIAECFQEEPPYAPDVLIWLILKQIYQNSEASTVMAISRKNVFSKLSAHRIAHIRNGENL
jgi:hypothetical protein